MSSSSSPAKKKRRGPRPPPPEVSPFRADVLAGRVALITGGGSGIGFTIAQQLLAHGASGVVIMGRRAHVLADACKRLDPSGAGRAAYAAGDVRNAEDTARAVKVAVDTYGRLDTLVNSAAGNFLAAAEHIKPKGFRTVLEIDAIGTFNTCSAAFAALKASGRGSVLNISATLHYAAAWYQAHAAAAKAAIDSTTRSLALEWGKYNIRVNGIAPGPIADTAGLTKLSAGVDQAVLERQMARAVPLGRMGTRFEIAMAAVWLCTDSGAGYATGTTVVVDGGAWLWSPPPIPRHAVAAMARAVEAKSRAKL